ncbi:UbiA prenyltransferase family-domain-containing protein [Ostreococcus tauri]|uniref:UbiA prenyltransferase family-domain-containing protein n=1 Tax=Ostreococcus tauri TaxID=70448 RepID=A0A1Y5HXH5_OSTTA|nr:UbiA prenyltransferase family-domain-containing protein [Ostreococcus tauri]
MLATASGISSREYALPPIVRFSRPHTVLGTTISVCSVTFVAACSSHGKLSYNYLKPAQALIPAVLMNVGIVGLNQVYDKKIDMVNKSYLPLASGEFSSSSALLIVSLSVTCSLVLGMLLQTLRAHLRAHSVLLLGVLYSVDWGLLRWKRYPILAATCIILVRAFAVHIGFFLHARYASCTVTPHLVHASLSKLTVIVTIMSMYSVVIALFKDLPDISGDSLHGIKTVSVRFGVRRTFYFCVVLLLLASVCSESSSFTFRHLTFQNFKAAGHFCAATVMLVKARRVDISSSASLHAYYMSIWRLFYLEYFLLPLLA